MELQELFKISKTTCLRSEPFKILTIMIMELKEVKEVTIITYKYLILIVRDRSKAICELMSDP